MKNPTSKYLQVRRLNWVVVLRPMADLLGGVETDELARALKSAESYQGIVINLSNVRRINPLGLTPLVMGGANIPRLGTKMALCCIAPEVERLLGQAGLRPPANFSSEDEAVRFCSER